MVGIPHVVGIATCRLQDTLIMAYRIRMQTLSEILMSVYLELAARTLIT